MEQTPPADHVGLSQLLSLLTRSDVDVAEAVGVSPGTIRSWRSGRRSPSRRNRVNVMRVARMHALQILRLARELEGDGEGAETAGHAADDLRRLTGNAVERATPSRSAPSPDPEGSYTSFPRGLSR